MKRACSNRPGTFHHRCFQPLPLSSVFRQVAAAKTLGNHIELRAFFPACRRFEVRNGFELPLQLLKHGVLGPTAEYLGQKRPAGNEIPAGKIDRDLKEMRGAQMVSLFMTRCRRRQVRQDNIRFVSTERFHQSCRCVVIQKILFQEHRAAHMIHVQIVDPDDLWRVNRRFDSVDRNLTPAARCAAQVNHPVAGFQELVHVVDFAQFVSCPRPVSIGLGTADIWIVQLPGQPAGRRFPPSGRCLDLDVHSAITRSAFF